MNFNQKLPDKTRCYFRLLVSAYLVYLGVSILKGTLKGEAKGVILPIIAVAFIVFGIGYAIFSLRILFQILKAEKGGANTGESPEYQQDSEREANPKPDADPALITDVENKDPFSA